MIEWKIPNDITADLSGYDFSNPKELDRAIDNSDLDEMSTYYTKNIEFKDSELTYDYSKPISTGFSEYPGVFNVTFSDGRPTKFTLDEKSLDNIISLDAFEIGLEEFTLSYNEQGFPAKLSGKKMGFFSYGGDNQYNEIYRDYKTDSHGNWIQRTVISNPGDRFECILTQYREYKY